jgi:hypothetical protein
MSKLTKVEFLNNAQSDIEIRNEQHEKKLASLSVDQFDTKHKFNIEVTSCKSRVIENNKLAAYLKDDSIASFFYTHNLIIKNIISENYSDSREFKLRLMKIVRAIVKDNFMTLAKCDKKLFLAISRKKAETKSLKALKIQKIMNHTTTTQADYLSNLCQYLKFATVHKDNDANCVTFDIESTFYKKIIALFDNVDANYEVEK